MVATVARAESWTTDDTVLHDFLHFGFGGYPILRFSRAWLAECRSLPETTCLPKAPPRPAENQLRVFASDRKKVFQAQLQQGRLRSERVVRATDLRTLRKLRATIKGVHG